MRSTRLIGLLAAVAASTACGDSALGPASGTISVRLDPEAIAVGLDSLVAVEVVRSFGGDSTSGPGEEVLIQASDGGFQGPSLAGPVVIRRLLDNSVTALLRPPERLGSVVIVARGSGSEDHAVLKLVPAPPPVVGGVPDSTIAGSATLVTVSVDPLWSGKPVAIRVTGGAITAIGPAPDGTPTSASALALPLDGTGRVSALWTLPGQAGVAAISVDLFGTTTVSQTEVIESGL